ncbi:MAG: hypothetical protein M3018_07040 [Actinomycetota bacterium]|nr:hypothetical protein [Actinomycetota bacterium]
MQAAHSNRPRAMALIVALVLALGAVLAFALLSGSTRTAQAATGHHKHHARHHSRAAAEQPGGTDTDNIQSGDQTAPDLALAGSRESTGGPDTDNVQSGDQTGPDPAGAKSSESTTGPDPAGAQSGDTTTPDPAGATPGESTGSSESSVESEQGQPGEPANGHQDPAGASGDNCTGNCVQ